MGFEATVVKVKEIYRHINRMDKPLGRTLKGELQVYEHRLERIDSFINEINIYMLKVAAKKEGIALMEVASMSIDDRYITIERQLDLLLESTQISPRDKGILEAKKARLEVECDDIALRTEELLALFNKYERVYNCVVEEFGNKAAACQAVLMLTKLKSSQIF